LFDEFGWWHTGFRGRLLNFLTVLIDPGQKTNGFAFKPMIARNYVGQYFLVRVPDMRRRVCVIDRGGDVERFRHFKSETLNPNIEIRNKQERRKLETQTHGRLILDLSFEFV